MQHQPIITAVVAIFGDYSRVHDEISAFLEEFSDYHRKERNQFEWVFVLQERGWRHALPLDALLSENVQILISEEEEDLPAVLFNLGAEKAKGTYLSFAWPGIKFQSWIDALEQLTTHRQLDHNVFFIAGHPSLADQRGQAVQSWKNHQSYLIPRSYFGGWLEMLDYVPMSTSLVGRAAFLTIGGFCSSPLLQRHFWWEFTVRFTRTDIISMADVAASEAEWSWETFPLVNDLPLSGDLAARRVVRYGEIQSAPKLRCDWDDVEYFVQDLPISSRKYVSKIIHEWQVRKPGDELDIQHSARDLVPEDDPLRVVVLGGLNEPAHNQLCFFNFFRLLENKRKLTWRVILDEAAHPVDLLKADLVIFSRIKSAKGCRLMDYCVENSIPTIYMLDDNWFSIGEDWIEYASIFSPGSELYELFIYCLVRANNVVTYNKTLADDLKPYSQKLTVLNTNIDLSLFPERQTTLHRRLRIGYAGSPRKENSAFKALYELARERDDFDIFFMGAAIPDELQNFGPHRLIYYPYAFSYRQYAQILSESNLDILLAPLADTRTDASKCPNKYLEITAAGAVGVYSDVEPYSSFITDRKNGMLVANDVDAWKSALRLLMDTPTLRTKILTAAKDDVYRHFDTAQVLPEFETFLHRAANAANSG